MDLEHETSFYQQVYTFKKKEEINKRLAKYLS